MKVKLKQRQYSNNSLRTICSADSARRCQHDKDCAIGQDKQLLMTGNKLNQNESPDDTAAWPLATMSNDGSVARHIVNVPLH